METPDYVSIAKTLLTYGCLIEAASDPPVLAMEDMDYLIDRGFLYRASDSSVGFTDKGDAAAGRLLEGESASSVLA